jgi:hypothetical protein
VANVYNISLPDVVNPAIDDIAEGNNTFTVNHALLLLAINSIDPDDVSIKGSPGDPLPMVTSDDPGYIDKEFAELVLLMIIRWPVKFRFITGNFTPNKLVGTLTYTYSVSMYVASSDVVPAASTVDKL